MEPILTEMESLFKALSDKTRLQITLFIMEKGEVTVNEIADGIKKSQSLVSHHLSCLKNCGIVKAKRDGKFSLYYISDDNMKQIINLAIKHITNYGNSILSCDIIKEENTQNSQKITL